MADNQLYNNLMAASYTGTKGQGAAFGTDSNGNVIVHHNDDSDWYVRNPLAKSATTGSQTTSQAEADKQLRYQQQLQESDAKWQTKFDDQIAYEYPGASKNASGNYVDANGNPISGSAMQGVAARAQRWDDLGKFHPISFISRGAEAVDDAVTNFRNADLYGGDYQARLVEDIMAGRDKTSILTSASNDNDFGYYNYVSQGYDTVKGAYDNRDPNWAKTYGTGK